MNDECQIWSFGWSRFHSSSLGTLWEGVEMKWGILKMRVSSFVMKETRILTDKSRLLVSRLDTARTTPDRHSHSESFWIFGLCGLRTEIKRLPTNSSRYRQAISHTTYPLWAIYSKIQRIFDKIILWNVYSQITLRKDTSTTLTSRRSLGQKLRYRK